MTDFPKTEATLYEGIDRNLHYGAQVYIAQAGTTLADFAVGTTDGTHELTTDHWMLWLSSGKPLTAVAIAKYWQAGELSLDDSVTRYLPEFGAGGKAQLTIRHLLTHTGGFRIFDLGWQSMAWSEILEQICKTPLEEEWVPGQTAGYHVASSWYVLGEILCRITGKDFSTLLHEEVCKPLGMPNTWNGIPAKIAEKNRSRIAPVWSRTREGLKPHSWDSPEVVSQMAPGGNTRGPIRELGRFYESLLRMRKKESSAAGQGGALLSPQTVEAITARHRTGLYDQTFRHVMDFGLGFILDSKQYGAETLPYSFGPVASPRTFGHGGAQSSLGFADPEQELVVVYATNGMPGEPQNHRRNMSIMQAIADDLKARR